MYYYNNKNNTNRPYVIQNAFNVYNANNYGKSPEGALFNLMLNQNHSPYIQVRNGDYMTTQKNPLFVQGIQQWQNMLKNQNAAKYNNFNNNAQPANPYYPQNTNNYQSTSPQPYRPHITNNYGNSTQPTASQSSYPYNTNSYGNNTPVSYASTTSTYNTPTNSVGNTTNYNSSNANIYSSTSNPWQEKQPEVEAYKQRRAKIWQDSLAHKSYEAKIDKEGIKLEKERFDKDTQDGIAFITNGFIQGLDPVSDNVFRASAYNYANNDQPFGSYNNSNLVRASQIAKDIVDWEKQNGFTNILEQQESKTEAPRQVKWSQEQVLNHIKRNNEIASLSQPKNNQTMQEQIELRNIKSQITRLGYTGDTNNLPNNMAFLSQVKDRLLAMQEQRNITNTVSTQNITQNTNQLVPYRVPGTNTTVYVPQFIVMQGAYAIQKYAGIN